MVMLWLLGIVEIVASVGELYFFIDSGAVYYLLFAIFFLFVGVYALLAAFND